MIQTTEIFDEFCEEVGMITQVEEIGLFDNSEYEGLIEIPSLTHMERNDHYAPLPKMGFYDGFVLSEARKQQKIEHDNWVKKFYRGI